MSENKISTKIGNFTRYVGDGVIPNKYRTQIQAHLKKAGIRDIPYFSYGITTYLTILLSLLINIAFVTRPYFYNFPLIIKIVFSIIAVSVLTLAFYFVVMFIYRVYLDSLIYKKIKSMEEVLPDYLAALSLNLKSGQSLGVAIESSVEKEFGHLSEEMMLVSRKIKLGGDVELAVRSFLDNYDSRSIRESFELILISWKKGANTPKLVDRLVENLSVSKYLRDKIIAGVTNYKIFLSVLAILISPAMFALTFYMIDLIRDITGQLVDVSDNVVLPMIVNSVRVNDAHFILFSSIIVVCVSVSISAIISIVKTGSIKESYKQLFFYAVGSYVGYKVFMWVFGIFFSLFTL